MQFLGATFGELREQTEDRLNLLRQQFDVVVIRECEIRAQLKTNKEKKLFFDECTVRAVGKKILKTARVEAGLRLKPREAMHGGHTCNYATVLKSDETHVIKYYDFCRFVQAENCSYPFSVCIRSSNRQSPFPSRTRVHARDPSQLKNVSIFRSR